MEKIIFKPMSYDELSISLERLQRFKNPFKKYDRVYKEILFKHLISPKISLKNYHEFSSETLNFLVQHIWNESVKKINPDCTENYVINSYIFYEEAKEFSVNEIMIRLESDFTGSKNILKDIFEMSYPLNISGFLEIAETQTEVSKNIKRLIWLNNLIKKQKPNLEETYKLAEVYRNENCAKKPLKLIILAEGITEEILLPVFGSVAGINFDKNGIEILASGGKNPAARIYTEIYQETNLPILIILDNDAQEIADEIKKHIRPQDKLHLISGGEFEDILPDDLIFRAVNSHYALIGKIEKEELGFRGRKTDCLSNLWKLKGFGEFKKAEFAHIIAENIKTPADLSEGMQKIIQNISSLIV